MDANATESDGILQALSNDLAAAVEKAGRSVVAIHARRRIPASGVCWRPGVVVAASHTLEREEDIRVTLDDGSSVAAEIAGRDPGTDLAVLRLSGGELPVAETGGPAGLRVGSLVLALGRPWEGGVTASLGLISAVGGEWRTWHGGRINRLVRLDLTIRDGFSGGPLVDADGRVLGINSSALARAAALTVPAVTVDRIADELLAKGHVARGYLGIGTQSVRLPEGLVRSLGLEREVGLMIVNVEPGSPADGAGLLLGDVLVTLEGTPVSDPADVAALLGPDRVGQPVEVQLVRAGTSVTASVTVGERPRGRRR